MRREILGAIAGTVAGSALSVGASKLFKFFSSTDNSQNALDVDFEVPLSTSENDCCVLMNTVFISCDCCEGDIIGQFWFAKKKPEKEDTDYFHFCSECWKNNFNKQSLTDFNKKITDEVKKLQDAPMSFEKDIFEIAVDNEKARQLEYMKKYKLDARKFAKKNDSVLRPYKSFKLIEKNDFLQELLRKMDENTKMFNFKPDEKIDITPELMQNALHFLSNFDKAVPVEETERESMLEWQKSMSFFIYDSLCLSILERLKSQKFTTNVDEWREFYDPHTGIYFKHPECLIPIVHGGSSAMISFTVSDPSKPDAPQLPFKVLPSFDIQAVFSTINIVDVEPVFDRFVENNVETPIQDVSVIAKEVIITPDGTKIRFSEIVGSNQHLCRFSGGVGHSYLAFFQANGRAVYFIYNSASRAMNVFSLDFVLKFLRTIQVRPFERQNHSIGIYHPSGFSFELPNHYMSSRFVINSLTPTASDKIRISGKAITPLESQETVDLTCGTSTNISNLEATFSSGTKETVVTKHFGKAALYATKFMSVAAVPLSNGTEEYAYIKFSEKSKPSFDLSKMAADSITTLQIAKPSYVEKLQAPKDVSYLYRNAAENIQWFVPKQAVCLQTFPISKETDRTIFSTTFPFKHPKAKRGAHESDVQAQIRKLITTNPVTTETLSNIAQGVVESLKFESFAADIENTSCTVQIPLSNGDFITGYKISAVLSSIVVCCITFVPPNKSNEALIVQAFSEDRDALPVIQQLLTGFTVLVPCADVLTFHHHLQQNHLRKDYSDITIIMENSL